MHNLAQCDIKPQYMSKRFYGPLSNADLKFSKWATAMWKSGKFISKRTITRNVVKAYGLPGRQLALFNLEEVRQ